MLIDLKFNRHFAIKARACHHNIINTPAIICRRSLLCIIIQIIKLDVKKVLARGQRATDCPQSDRGSPCPRSAAWIPHKQNITLRL